MFVYYLLYYCIAECVKSLHVTISNVPFALEAVEYGFSISIEDESGLLL